MEEDPQGVPQDPPLISSILQNLGLTTISVMEMLWMEVNKCAVVAVLQITHEL